MSELSQSRLDQALRVLRKELGPHARLGRLRPRRVLTVHRVFITEELSRSEAGRMGRIARSSTLREPDSPALEQMLRHLPSRDDRQGGYRAASTAAVDVPPALQPRIAAVIDGWARNAGREPQVTIRCEAEDLVEFKSRLGSPHWVALQSGKVLASRKVHFVPIAVGMAGAAFVGVVPVGIVWADTLFSVIYLGLTVVLVPLLVALAFAIDHFRSPELPMGGEDSPGGPGAMGF